MFFVELLLNFFSSSYHMGLSGFNIHSRGRIRVGVVM